MSPKRKLFHAGIFVAVREHLKENRIGYGALTFWYLAQFPGRLGFDYSESIRLIRAGKSTDWWTGEFFWFLRITSLGGRTIALTSLICLMILAYSLKEIIKSLIQDKKKQAQVFSVICFSPIVGNFGVNISHDIFLAAGILILISRNIENLQASERNLSADWQLLIAKYLFPSLLLLTSQLGRLVIVSLILYLVLRKNLMNTIPLVLVLVAVFSMSNFTVTRFDKNTVILPIIFDLKCVTQHSEADLNEEEWAELEKIAPIDEWKTPTSCTLGDAQLQVMPNLKLQPSFGLIKTYIGVTAKNPAIVIMAHIQRSRGALPPPFFQGPDNQVLLDPSIPIGLGTNTALQNGTELLHPSIDEPSVNKRVPALRILEPFAQIPIFLVNQASWFWGWGALWMYPVIYLMLKLFGKRFMLLIFPILVLHLSLVVIGPGPFGRYVMASILLGQIAVVSLLLNISNSRKVNL